MLDVKLLKKVSKINDDEILTRETYDIAGYILIVDTSISKSDASMFTSYSVNESADKSMPRIFIDRNSCTGGYDITLSSYCCMYDFTEIGDQISALITAKEAIETIKDVFHL